MDTPDHVKSEQNEQYDKIVAALSGTPPDLPDTDRRWIDWEGIRVILEMYRKTTGTTRDEMIQALGDILDHAEQHPPEIAAQVLSIVTALQLTQLHTEVLRLKGKDIARTGVLRSEVDRYFAYGNRTNGSTDIHSNTPPRGLTGQKSAEYHQDGQADLTEPAEQSGVGLRDSLRSFLYSRFLPGRS